MNKLIGITGLKGSGKSTTADFICKELPLYTRERMASILKDMLRVLGLDHEQLDGNAKETESAILCGMTPRHAMQTLGTEWGRNCIHPDLWVSAMEAKLNLFWTQNPYAKFVIDDIRFENEVEMVSNLGGEIWLIHRDGIIVGDHQSERDILSLPYDHLIKNDGTLNDLKLRVLEALR